MHSLLPDTGASPARFWRCALCGQPVAPGASHSCPLVSASVRPPAAGGADAYTRTCRACGRAMCFGESHDGPVWRHRTPARPIAAPTKEQLRAVVAALRRADPDRSADALAWAERALAAFDAE